MLAGMYLWLVILTNTKYSSNTKENPIIKKLYTTEDCCNSKDCYDEKVSGIFTFSGAFLFFFY